MKLGNQYIVGSLLWSSSTNTMFIHKLLKKKKKCWGYCDCLPPSVMLSPHKPLEEIKPNLVYEFQGHTSFVDHLCYLCLAFVMLLCLSIAALWSLAGKGLTSPG